MPYKILKNKPANIFFSVLRVNQSQHIFFEYDKVPIPSLFSILNIPMCSMQLQHKSITVAGYC